MNITELTVHELIEKLKNKELTSTEITDAYINKIEEKEKDVKAYVTILKKQALKQANEKDEKRKTDKDIGEFAGIPIGIKDNICTKGIKTTCSSHMQENFISPYNATVMEKIEKENIIDIGKLNMDEFAMGGTT